MKRATWHSALSENFSYKLVALFIALILWLTVLGRRDFVLTKDMDLDFKVPAQDVIVAQTADHIRIKVSGPRAALKKFVETQGHLVLDISDRGEGLIDVDVTSQEISVPPGVKVMGVRPNLIRVEVSKKKDGN